MGVYSYNIKLKKLSVFWMPICKIVSIRIFIIEPIFFVSKIGFKIRDSLLISRSKFRYKILFTMCQIVYTVLDDFECLCHGKYCDKIKKRKLMHTYVIYVDKYRLIIIVNPNPTIPNRGQVHLPNQYPHRYHRVCNDHTQGSWMIPP